MSFQDKVAIVTGGSRGIGRAIVQALAAAGAKVAFTYVQNKALADEVAQGDSVVAYQADVTSFEQAKELVKQVKEKFGHIDILVNNAGITRDKLILRMSEKDWDDVIDTNLKGAFNVSKPVVAAMVSQRSGTILNITSISGLVGMPGQVNYSSSKAGMIGFTKALAKEIAKANITVNALALGFVETDMTAVLNEEYRTKALAQIPLGRIGKPENMAEVAMFLVSDKANYITGQVIQFLLLFSSSETLCSNADTRLSNRSASIRSKRASSRLSCAEMEWYSSVRISTFMIKPSTERVRTSRRTSIDVTLCSRSDIRSFMTRRVASIRS
jgi:3-oxoacyl-[acyl-carrier protein] reductase